MCRCLLCLFACVGLVGVSPAADRCEALIEQSNTQLEAMRRHAASIQESLQDLNEALIRAERRNAEQTREIERLNGI